MKFLNFLLFLTCIACGQYSFSKSSGLPIPRFVSLRSSEVNLRVGPGHHFPTEWVYRRANLPVEIVAEFGDWRKVRDLDSTQGWIHRSLLSGHRYVVVLDDRTPLRTSDDTDAPTIAFLQVGALAKLQKCSTTFCYVQIRQATSYKGWVPKRSLWGVGDKD